jgi:Anaerobic dehydrogenases, typically selenocysteine-containing
VLEPASDQLRSEPAIVAGLAQATFGDRSTVDWEGLIANYDRIRDHIENVIPGFERFNERIAEDIFYLPNAARDERKFNTDIGKAKFMVHPIPRNELPPGRYILMTIRSHDQFNTHLYGLDDRYRGVFNGRKVIFMNVDDVAAAGLKRGQLVDLTSHHEDEERTVRDFQIVPTTSRAVAPRPIFPKETRSFPSTASRSDRIRRRASS